MNILRKLNYVHWGLIGGGILLLLLLFLRPVSGIEDLDISQVLLLAEAGEIARIEIQGNSLEILTKGGEIFNSRKEGPVSILELLDQRGVQPGSVAIVVKEESRSFFGIFLSFLPLLVFGGLLFYMFRRTKGGLNQAMNIGKSQARLVMENRSPVTFSDVAGADESKQELVEIVEFLKYPEKFAKLGAKIPRGVLLVGSPGTGKTLISKAVAGEAGVPFFSISGSEFVEMFVGVGASRVRDLFARARQHAPAIVFIDEIDAVGRHRGSGYGGGNDEREQTLNQILVEMDGFDERTNVIIIAATNRPDVLDPALLRPGRFDRRVVMSLPDVKGREEILKVHLSGKPVLSDVNVPTVAKETHGFSGADLANLVNEAAILAARNGRTGINLFDMEESIDRVLAGPARRSRKVSEKEKEIVAYHEAGHALVASSLPAADPVHKVTIVPRGQAGGYTRLLPEEDRSLWSKGQFEAMLAVMMGGQAAEEIVFGDITTGASNDLQNANGVARRMVTEYGMSTSIGPRTFDNGSGGMTFMGREVGQGTNYSEAVAEKIDNEIGNLLTMAQQTAKNIINENRIKLNNLANRLLIDETVEGVDLRGILDGPVVDAPVVA
ncbi:MAG: ATP-dependent zinc metalloprotease FtsH [Chloroflexi bacterium]|nr:ATP-dependent zinc metalloprotease FtsH [Chloroflexota bacterium]MDA1219276.1 ATP-dependent zinc metalloprotease FtsH [Chloroflexota bacterium]